MEEGVYYISCSSRKGRIDEEEVVRIGYGCFRVERAGWKERRRKGDRRKGRQRDEGSRRESKEREEEERKTEGDEE